VPLPDVPLPDGWLPPEGRLPAEEWFPPGMFGHLCVADERDGLGADGVAVAAADVVEDVE
jgi:hypothetical protein